MLKEQLASVVSTFSKNVESVNELMQFDVAVLDFVVQHLESLQERLTAIHGDNSRLNVSNTLSMLRNIRSNDSLQPHYSEMLNQCNVLLVSYFSSAAADIFKAGVNDAVKRGTRTELMKQDLTIDLGQIREIGAELMDRVGELLLESHREINLQNMQSIAVAFQEYLGYERKQDEVVNDIILSHACRHVIVHCGAVADRKMIGQLRAARPRTLKSEIREGERVQFTESEVTAVGQRMISYLQDVANGIHVL